MKEYKVYVCEKCGQEFAGDYEKCQKHEASHIGIKLFTEHKPEYLGPDSIYPNYIEVEMVDGSIRAYEATGVIIRPEQKENPLASGEED